MKDQDIAGLVVVFSSSSSSNPEQVNGRASQEAIVTHHISFQLSEDAGLEIHSHRTTLVRK